MVNLSDELTIAFVTSERCWMIYVFMGPPASGKSTQSKFLSATLEIPSISIGDFLREKSREDKVLQQSVNQGHIVSDGVITNALDHIHEQYGDNVIIDGIPRSASQIQCFFKFWKPNQIVTIHLEVPDNELRQRIQNRFTTTGQKRADDTPEIANRRIELYRQTEPEIISDLNKYGIQRIQINGNQTPELVHDEIVESLRTLGTKWIYDLKLPKN